jgi:DMSO/TMAO reductase YedYZ molybdopterin-dependent catalytic subunit
MSVVSRGFGRRPRADERLPPGQYDVGTNFPVLSAGPTPRTALTEWDLTIQGEVPGLRRWNWEEFLALPREAISVDIHCVTKWSKFATRWEGVSVDTLLTDVSTEARYVLAFATADTPRTCPLTT